MSEHYVDQNALCVTTNTLKRNTTCVLTKFFFHAFSILTTLNFPFMIRTTMNHKLRSINENRGATIKPLGSKKLNDH